MERLAGLDSIILPMSYQESDPRVSTGVHWQFRLGIDFSLWTSILALADWTAPKPADWKVAKATVL
jgi:predicted alpha/beta hydrolase family esterase